MLMLNPKFTKEDFICWAQADIKDTQQAKAKYLRNCADGGDASGEFDCAIREAQKKLNDLLSK